MVYGNLEIIIQEIEYSVNIDVKNPDNIATIKYTINNNSEQSAKDKLNIK